MQIVSKIRKIPKKAWIAAALAVILLVLGVYLLTKPRGMAHYLLLGVDGWGVNTQGAGRSDVIMLASLDYNKNRISLTSIARDSLVSPEGGAGDVKINALVRRQAGEQGLVDYLETTYGLPIEGYFVVNFSGAVEIIDAVGGVTVELAENEVSYLKKHAGDYAYYPLHAGQCRLNGAQALAFMRCRNLDSDFGRQDRQGKVLRAVMEELRHITAGKALQLLEHIDGLYRTDLSAAQVVNLAKNAVHLRGAQMHKYAIPTHKRDEERGIGGYNYATASDGSSGIRYNIKDHRALLYEWLELTDPAANQEGES